jgi:hypothetical protein
MHTSESLSPQPAGSTARRTYANAAKRGTQIVVTTLMLCLTLSACGGGNSVSADGASDSKLGSDNKTREVHCAR